MSTLLSFENPIFAQFALYAGVSVVKTMGMSFVTVVYRRTKKIFANPEDCRLVGKNIQPNLADEDVERVRRCHLNDLENVIPFVLIGGLYVLTKPSAYAASLHFRIFAAARIFHTIAYLLSFPQPCRGFGFLVGYGATISMAISVLRSATV